VGVEEELHPLPLPLHGGQHLGGETIKIGRNPDFTAKRARASGRPFHPPRRYDLGEHLIMGHDQERATLAGLTEILGRVSSELARANTFRLLVCL
jgi:hypothetical protein